MNEWIDHDGGKCSIPPNDLVDVEFVISFQPYLVDRIRDYAKEINWRAVKRYRFVNGEKGDQNDR
jgi:hypothetical protein